MSKQKTRGNATIDQARIRAGIRSAEALAQNGEFGKAQAKLEPLLAQHPENVELLETLVDLALDQNDMPRYCLRMQRLLEVQPNRAELHLAIGGAACALSLPLTALAAFRAFLEKRPADPTADRVRKTIRDLEASATAMVKELGLERPANEPALLLHERTQLLLAAGRFQDAIAAARATIALGTPLVAPHNNLALALFAAGDLAGAVDVCRQVLTKDPDHVHALSNICHFLIVSGDLESARSMAQRLEGSSTRKGSDRWLKICEAHAFLGDDAAVLRAFDLAEKERTGLREPHEALMCLWAAASALRLGQERQARQLLERAQKLKPSNGLATQLLDSLNGPPETRLLPFHHPVSTWIPQAKVMDIAAATETLLKGPAAQRPSGARKLLEKFPELRTLVPIWLDRGDPPAIFIAIGVSDVTREPHFLAALRRFATGGRGLLKDRRRAAEIADVVAELPAELRFVEEKGSLKKLEFEIYAEPARRHPREVERMAEEAFELLSARQSRKAEKVLREAIQMQPNAPDLLNNLANAYALQGRKQEAVALLEDIHRRFPDYSFARVQLAREALRKDDGETAEALVEPLLALRRLHVTELSALCAVQIELQLWKRDAHAAAMWLKMLEGGCPSDPQLPKLQALVANYGAMKRLAAGT